MPKGSLIFHLANWDFKPAVPTPTALLPPVSDPSKSSETGFLPAPLQDFPTLKCEGGERAKPEAALDTGSCQTWELWKPASSSYPASSPPSSVCILGSEVKATAQPLPDTNKYQPRRAGQRPGSVRPAVMVALPDGDGKLYVSQLRSQINPI